MVCQEIVNLGNDGDSDDSENIEIPISEDER
jgi:hypothetical protein